MKKLLSLLLVFALLIGATGSFTLINASNDAETSSIPDGLEYVKTEYGVEITGYSGAESEIVIPEIIEGYSVTSISEWAFAGLQTLEVVTIPKTVDVIGGHSFFQCSGIKRVHLSVGLQSVEEYAFYECPNLKVYYDGTPGSWSSIEIASTCWSLLEDKNIYYYCDSLSADGMYFYYNGYDEFNYIGLYRGNSSEVVIPETIDGCQINRIGENSFLNCTSLESLVIPETIQYVYDDAFRGCTNLREIEISAKTNIYFYAFAECKNLSLVKYRGTKEEWETLRKGNPYLRDCSVILNYGTSLADFVFELDETAKTVTITGYEGFNTEIVIPEAYGEYTVTSVSPTAFAGNTVITGISVPKTVETIDEGSFEGCTALKNVTLAEGTVDIGDYAFAGCTALESIIIPEGTEAVWRNAFEGCSSLRTIKLPSTIEVIDYKAFYDCDSLKYVIYDGSAEEFEAVEVVSGNNPLLSASFTYLADMESNVIPGDIDGDNVLTVKDINLIKRIISCMIEADPGSDTYLAADFDSNGIVNAMDSNAMKRAFVGVGN